MFNYLYIFFYLGKQGQPSLGKLFQYPKFDTPVACKSFFQVSVIIKKKKLFQVLFTFYKVYLTQFTGR